MGLYHNLVRVGILIQGFLNRSFSTENSSGYVAQHLGKTWTAYVFVYYKLLSDSFFNPLHSRYGIRNHGPCLDTERIACCLGSGLR
jgi:hypothetical protein